MKIMNPSDAEIVAELHAEVKRRSSVPKVASAINMNYYSLRDNLMGKSDIRLATMYLVLDAIGMTWEELLEHTRVSQAHSND